MPSNVMPAKKLRGLSSIFASTVKNDFRKTNQDAAADLLTLKKPEYTPNSSSHRNPTPPVRQKIAKNSVGEFWKYLPSARVTAEESDKIEDSAGNVLKEISAILCGCNATESPTVPSSLLPGSELSSDNVLDIPWFPKVSSATISERRKQLSRDRKQKWIFKNSQTRRFQRLVQMCAQKLGSDATMTLFGKLGRETGVKEYNALIKVCIEKTRESKDEEEALDHIHNAFQLLRSMRERGFPLEEETYAPLLIYLINTGMVQEFQLFHALIENDNPTSLARLGYYQMLLWITVKNEEKIQELCNSVGLDGSQEGFSLAESYLVALSETDRDKELLKLLEVVDIVRISCMEHVVTIFKSLGRLFLENCAGELILALKKSKTEVAHISSFIFYYASSMPNLGVEDVITKFKDLHVKFEVLPTSMSYEKLIVYCCDSLKVHAALDIVDSMCQSGLAISSETFRPILCASGQSFDHDLVRPIYTVMRRHGLTLNSEIFTSMIKLHARMRDFEGAYNMLEDLEQMDLKPTINMYNAIMAGYFREKNNYGGFMVLKQMKDANVKPDSETFSYLLNNSKCEEDIIKFKEEMDRSGVAITKQVYMALVNAYANIGQFEKAKQVVLDEGLPVKNINEIKSVLVSALAYNGQILDAHKTYEEIKRSGCQLDPKAIISLIEYPQSDGELDKLLELLEDLKDTSYWLDGCRRIIIYCVRFKHLSSAVDLLKQLKEKDELLACVIFDQIFSNLMETEPADLDIGLNLLRVMKEELNLQPSRSSLDFLLSSCVSAKDPHRAWLIWGEYEKAGLPFNILTYLRMYQVFLAAGERKSAAHMLKNVPKDDPDVRCIVKACQATFGNSASAKSKKKK